MDSTILLDTNLNKNVKNIIIDYLTDPPVLPFIGELIYNTASIFDDVQRFWFYTNSYTWQYDNNRSIVISNPYKIGFSHAFKWMLKSN